MKETVYEMDIPVSIALISDLHARPYSDVLALLQQRRPDLICIAGDLFHSHPPTEPIPLCLMNFRMLGFLRACAMIAPCFLSLGNHEWMLSPQDFSRIQRTGARVLDNSWVSLGSLQVGGLTSAYVADYRKRYEESDRYFPRRSFRRQDEPVPSLGWLEEFEKQPGFKILLSHHPEYREKYLADRDIDLILSGHAHGGQIRLFGQGLFSPGQGLLPKLTSGIHGNMVISTGLTNTGGIVPRLFNPPELVFIKKHLPEQRSAG